MEMIARKQLSPSDLNNLLRYDHVSGKLFWRPRIVTPGISQRTISVFNANRAGREAFTCMNAEGYLHGVVLGVPLKAHRVIWAMNFYKWPDGYIDHIDGDRSNNRVTNLRDVSPDGNSKNAAIRHDNKNGYIGVYKHRNRWIARIGAHGACYLGSFASIDDALSARKNAELYMGYHESHGRNSLNSPWRHK